MYVLQQVRLRFGAFGVNVFQQMLSSRFDHEEILDGWILCWLSTEFHNFPQHISFFQKIFNQHGYQMWI